MSDVQPGGPFPMRDRSTALRFVREEDVETLTAYRNDPDVNALQDWDLPPPGVPGAGSWSLPTRASTDCRGRHHHQVAIELDGELVGDVYVGITSRVASPRSASPLIPAAQGRGIAHESCRRASRTRRPSRHPHRIQAELPKDNLASQRLGSSAWA